MKRIVGKTNDVDEALKRLDILTKEENLLAAARTLEVAQHVDDKVTVIEEVLQDVNGNVRATQEFTCHVDQSISATKEVICGVRDDVTETRVLTQLVDNKVTAIKELTYELRSEVDEIRGDARSVNDNIKVTKHGAPRLFIFFYIYTDHSRSYTETAMCEMQRPLLPTPSSFIVVAETCS